MKKFIQNVGKYKSLLMFALVAVVCAITYFCGIGCEGGLIMAAPISLIGFAKEEKDLTNEEKSLLGSIQLKCKEVCEQFMGGMMTKEDIENKFKEISTSIADTH